MIKYVVDPINPDTALLSWEPNGDVSPYYTVYYGTNPEALNTQLIVSSTGATLSGLSLDEVTYAQVWPSDESGYVLGDPSDPLVIGLHQTTDAKCIVKGIILRSEQR